MAVVLRESPVLDVSAGEQKSGVVGGQLSLQPAGVGRSADKDEESLGGDRGAFSERESAIVTVSSSRSPPSSTTSEWRQTWTKSLRSI